MTYHKDQPVVIVPRTKVKAVNAMLERHGYGKGVVSVPIIGKSSSATAKPTHYALECPADSGMMAAIELAIKGVAGVHVKKGRRGPKRLQEELGKKNLKQKVRIKG